MLTCGGLFDGVGLLSYGLHLAGWEHSWLCERDPWRRSVLEQRWPGVPVYDDVRAVGHGVQPVTLVAGGFPCKGASTAGLRTGFDHPETVLWREMARAIRELRPRYVLVENVANILALHDGAVWGEVLGDLAASGYDVVWDCLPAGAVGAPHLRDRVFAIATYADGADSGRDGGLGREQDGRPDARRDLGIASSDPKRDALRQQPVTLGGRDGAALVGGHPEAAPDAEYGRHSRHQPERVPHRGEAAGSAQRCATPTADSDSARSDTYAAAGRPREAARERTGSPVAVDWADYRPAIERWERTLGRPAGEPLLSGVVARGARRVVRSRLSALGDGVQVQVGYIAGTYIAGLEQGRIAA